MLDLRITAVSLLLLMFASSLVLESLGADGEDAIVSTIGSAEEAVVSAYQAVFEAEEAGADISGLLERLNAAAEYLALAKICSRRGDLDSEAANARYCKEAAEGIVEDAKALRDRAAGETFERSSKVMIGSIIGAVVAASVSLFSWKIFKRRHYRRVLKMKPEVSEVES